MRKTLKNSLLLVTTIVILISFNILTKTAFANTDITDVIGIWKSIDDKTGKAKSLIEITVNNGVYSGTIIQILNAEKPNPICNKCKNELKDKPIKGLTIIKDISKKEDSWGGGTILDPKKGKVYSLKLTLLENGKKLKVRGFIGAPTFGRTQTWERQEN